MQINEIIEKLCNTAKHGLAMCYPNDKNMLPYTRKLNDDKLECVGFSLRYVAISQIGIAKWLKYHPNDSTELPDLWPVLLQNFGNITDIGDLSLSLWAGTETKADDCNKFAKALKESWTVKSHYCNAVELGWVVQACVMAEQLKDYVKFDMKSVCSQAHHRLMSLFNADTNLFRRHNRSGMTEFISKRISCFADQVYPILALSNYGTLFNDEKSLDFASKVTKQICNYQGPLGQWWWHYDAAGGKICEEYPVFSVHQDAMAPMAILASDKANKQDHSKNIELGLRWLFEKNELKKSLICDSEGVIWRDIERKELCKFSRSFRGLCCAAGLDRLHKLAGRFVRDFRINYECRPYHLGWILYAWADYSKTISQV